MPAAPVATLPRRERRKLEVHSRIIDAAVTLFDAQGYETTKIDQICERADVAQKTFFNHFPTKQHLVREIAQDFLDQLLVTLDEARCQPGPTQAQLAYFFRRIAEDAEQAGPMRGELVMEIIRVAHADRSEPEQARKLHAGFSALIRAGVKDGHVTREHSVEILTEMVLGAFYAIMLNWASLERYRLRQHAAEAGRFLGNALSGSEPRRSAARGDRPAPARKRRCR
jgi:AcrR family transcriptional regulator